MDEKVKNIIQQLKSSQKKITSQREKIIEYLFNNTHESHPTADDIFSATKNIDQGISISTVYNTIELLNEENLIEEFVTPLLKEKGKQSAIRIETNLNPHFNLICSKCTKIEDIIEKEVIKNLQTLILNKSHFLIERYEFYGLCSTCKKEN